MATGNIYWYGDQFLFLKSHGFLTVVIKTYTNIEIYIILIQNHYYSQGDFFFMDCQFNTGFVD